MPETHLQKRKRLLVEHPESTPNMLPYAYPPGPETHPAPECKLSLFQWQIELESRRYEGVAPELLNLQDGDGDT